MKKGIIFLITIGLLFFLTASSPWEGAAAVAPAGELPESGFFIATNSFPRNTVVDITNIETGRTTRVIVANTLSSSGLLAIVSREAAELIGMRQGSVSRVRMVQPSDPLAYLRFTERLAAGAPFIDPSITEERLLDELYRSDSYVPPATAPVVTAVTPPSALGEISELTSDRGYVLDEPEWGGSGRLNIVEVPGYIVEPVQPFTDTPPQRTVEPPYIIQSEPKTLVQTEEPPSAPPETPLHTITEPAVAANVKEPVPAEPVTEDPVYVSRMDYPESATETPVTETPVEIVKAPQEAREPAVEIAEAPEPVKEEPPYIASADNDHPSEVIKDISERIDEVQSAQIIKDATEFAMEIPPENIDKSIPEFIASNGTKNDIEKETSEFISEAPHDDIIKETPEFISEVPRDDIIKEISEFITEAPRDDVIKETNEWIEPVYTAEPTVGETPQEIAQVPQETTETPQRITETPQQITQAPQQIVPLVPVESTPRVPGQSVYDIPLNDIIPGITSTQQVETSAPAQQTPVPVQQASVQTSSVVTALPIVEQPFASRTVSQLDRGKYYVQLAALNAEMIDSTVRQIDPRFEPVVYKDRDNLYRVLIGPLNQGESAAVLQRFKSIGYNDAFVRYAN